VELRGRFVDTKKVNLDRFVEEEILAQSAGFERAAKRVERVLNSMAKIFTKRDPLLKAQGSLTVYYWFVREFRNDRRIREFLVNFDRDRRANSKIAKARGRRVDEELLQFDVLNRSTNDQGSLSGRFSILAKRFEAFRAPKD
jgi:hypothetical protein